MCGVSSSVPYEVKYALIERPLSVLFLKYFTDLNRDYEPGAIENSASKLTIRPIVRPEQQNKKSIKSGPIEQV